MSYLKSRENESRSQSRSGKRLNRRTEKQKPCSIERLLPPIELMTRKRSLRYLSWKYNSNSSEIKKLDCLVKKHRDYEYYENDRLGHNTIKENGIERINLEKEKSGRLKQNEQKKLPGVKKYENRLLPLMGEQKIKNNTMRGRKRSSFIDSATVVKAKTLFKNKNPTVSSKNNTELSFGESFSFLNDWRRESKRNGVILKT
jgi:hypothetical protein